MKQNIRKFSKNPSALQIAKRKREVLGSERLLLPFDYLSVKSNKLEIVSIVPFRKFV